MPISFTCPHCGRFTEVAEQYAGQSGACAGCGRTITIPSALGAAPLKPASPMMSRTRPARNPMSPLLIVAIVLGVMCLCGSPIMIALLLPAVQSAREAARRMSCTNNLKQIALAMHNYHDVYKCFPAGFVADEDGKPMHSWRIALLPFVENSPLYDQYNFDEPWDSPNNRMVADNMPDCFRCPSAPDSGPGSNLTHYVVVLSDSIEGKDPDSLFGGNRWMALSGVKDGTSNTLMVAEVRDPVPWTKPDADLHFNTMNFQPNSGPNSIGSYHPGGANVAFADGSVHYVGDNTDTQTLRLLIQPADGMPVQFNY